MVDVKGSNDEAQERDESIPTRRHIVTPIMHNQMSSAVIHKPPAVRAGVVKAGLSQGRFGVIDHFGDNEAETHDRVVGTKGNLTTDLTMGLGCASSEVNLRTVPNFLSENHQAIREMLQQGEC